MPIYWAIALGLVGAALSIFAAYCVQSREWQFAAISGVPGLALLGAFSVDVWQVLA